MACIVYYRPTIGDCLCRQEYDGRHDLLINLDNRHIFTYKWMLEILLNIQGTVYPIRASFNYANRLRDYCSRQGRMKEHMYQKLRCAYNSFTRLLDVNHSNNFICSQCKEEGCDVVIFDGISMGTCKDRMASNEIPPAHPGINIDDTQVNERLYLDNVPARKLLATYTGKNGGQMSGPDFARLKDLLSVKPSLKAVVEDAGNPCPQSLKKLLNQLACSNPTCGIIQIAGESVKETFNAIQEIANGNFIRIQSHIVLVKKYAPMLADFILSNDISQQHISSLLSDLLISIKTPFRIPLPGDDFYGDPATVDSMKLTFLPNHPPCRGQATYKANKRREITNECNKEYRKHNKLSPGVFTMVCPHGVCLGFHIMESPESPKVPFNMLMYHFNEMPSLIIYDNCCQLHNYILKREPTRFSNTRFMVDRLHDKTHKCTAGYTMDSYIADPKIKNINSQVCEQLNSALCKLRSSISGMPSHNAKHHLSVFLAIRNLDKNTNYESQ